MAPLWPLPMGLWSSSISGVAAISGDGVGSKEVVGKDTRRPAFPPFLQPQGGNPPGRDPEVSRDLRWLRGHHGDKERLLFFSVILLNWWVL